MQRRLNIVDVISKYVNLKKLGPGYTAPCPFCSANEANEFKVSVSRQKYSCQKCGSTGGVFQFLKAFKGSDIESALSEVRETFNIPFNAHFLDIQWNEYLKETDFEKVLSSRQEITNTFLEPLKSAEQSSSRSHPVSYTELATFIRCPLEYKMRYRDKSIAYEPRGTRVYLGRFLHSIATQFLKLPLHDRSAEFIETMFREEMAKKLNPEYKEELQRFQEPVILLLLQYFSNKTPSLHNPRFTSQLGPFTITGTVDCLIYSSDGTHIIEFKEYDYREFDDNLDVLRYLQLLFYYFGLIQRNIIIRGGAYCFFHTGYSEEIMFSDSLISQAEKFILDMIQQMIESNDFSAKPNDLCTSCGFRNECVTFIH